jgi:phosphatidylinositol phospholipase C, delta
VPPPNGREEKSFSAYVTAKLFHTEQEQKWSSKVIKTNDIPGEGGDLVWNEKFEWEFEADDLAFIR